MAENQEFVIQLQKQFPISVIDKLEIVDSTAMVVIDEVEGFCLPGAGNLAPHGADPMIENMITKTDQLARTYIDHNGKVILLRDVHDPERPEEPFSTHCLAGTKEIEIVPQLKWLLDHQANGHCELVDKKCINGFISDPGFPFHLKLLNVETLVVVGICTDICVMQFVQSALSARNCGFLGKLKNIVVCTDACATYDLPMETVKELGLESHKVHPQEYMHHMGLFLMQQCGTILAKDIVIK